MIFLPPAALAQGLTPYERYIRERQPIPTSVASDSFPLFTLENVNGIDGPALVSGPQLISGSDVVNKLKEQALGVVRGCNYTEYLELAQKVKAGWSMYKDWNDWNQVKRWAVPFMDLVSMFFRAGGVIAAKESAEKEGEGLIYQLEQLCNVVVQADEINRQYQIIKSGNLNMGNALDWLLDLANQKLAERIQRRAEERYIREHWVDLYDQAAPPMTPALDSLYRMMSEALRDAFAVSAEIEEALDQIDQDLEKARKDLLLKAEWDNGKKKWTCPEGYPDPNRQGVQYLDGHPICGPVGPVRSTQILAHLEVLKLSIRSLELRTHARGLEVDAIGLMADNVERKSRLYTRAQGMLAN